LHAILEKVTLGDLAPLEAWRQQANVRRLIETESRRWDRDPRYFDETARLVHSGLTTSIPMPDGSTLPGLACAARVRREVDFLFPFPLAVALTGAAGEDQLFRDGNFVRGTLDVLFEHGGRVCFADWKSNVLPSFSANALRAEVSLNYHLQVQLYTLALVRMLGITNQADYDRLFGGVVYLFLRGLGHSSAKPRPNDDGLYVHRPTFDDVERWSRDLADGRLAATESSGPTNPGSGKGSES
jgi:exodeoxyribonuclease V beta subunit